MKINFKEGIQIKNILANLINKKMPIKTSYKVMKIVTAIEGEETFFDQKMNLIITEFGSKNEKGDFIYSGENTIKIQEGKEEECQDRVKELESIEIEIPDVKISLEELENSIELTPKELYMLDKIIE